MSYNSPRIKLEMSMMDVFMALGEGNPGGLRVAMDLYKLEPQIDPDSIFGGLGVLLNLDTLDCYGSRIWMLYKYVCGEDYTKVFAVLRAIQLGITDEATVNHAVDNYGHGVDCDDLLTKVQAELPAFGKVAA